MKYMEYPLNIWERNGYNPIHLFGDFYLLRKYSIRYRRFSFYKIVKLHK